MSKMKRIEAIIFSVLQDKEWHSLTELKNEIRLQDETLLQNENYLNVILSRLKNKKHQIELKGKGIYRMITENEEMKEIKIDKERIEPVYHTTFGLSNKQIMICRKKNLDKENGYMN